MAIVDVIKYEGDNSTFVWKYPKSEFNIGSQLIVHESQEALFMYQGELLDKFGPGTHLLETATLPLAKNIMKLSTGGKNMFHCDLYFVNKVEQMAIKWGTDSKIQYLDPEYGFPVEIGASGQMSLAAGNSSKLLIKLVGTEKVLTQEQMVTYFRAFLMNRIKSIFPQLVQENKINIFAMDQYMQVLSDAIKIKLEDDFIDYGIDLRTFLITTIVKPEEDRNYIKFKELYYRQFTDVKEAELRQRIAIIEQQTKAQQTVIEAEATAKKRELEGYTYQQEKGFEVAMEMAGNDAVGQLNNVGIGLGMMTGVGGTVGSQVGAMATDALGTVSEQMKPKLFCRNCGKQLSPDSLFCDKCGTKVEQKKICSNCGNELAPDSLFCNKCGTKAE